MKHLLIGIILLIMVCPHGMCADEAPANTPPSAPQALKVELKPTEDGNAIMLTVDGQERVRLQANAAGWLRFEMLNNGHNIFLGENAGLKSMPESQQNIFIGPHAGIYNATGKGNTFLGFRAGSYSTASRNTCLGAVSGTKLGKGEDNTLTGYASGAHLTSGMRNTLLGAGAAGVLGVGNDNVMVGSDAGSQARTGSSNIFIGSKAGYRNADGSGNVYIGYQAGMQEKTSNRLFIENSNSATPLIYGEFDTDRVGINGALGVGTQQPAARLHLLHSNDAESDGLRIENVRGAGNWRCWVNDDTGDLLLFAGTTASAAARQQPAAMVQTTTGRLLSRSDSRLLIETDLLPDLLDKVLRLQPRRLQGAARTQFGFTAQELKALFPEVVVHDVRTDTYLVDYAGVSVLAVKALQEQQAHIAQLEKTQAALLERLEKLEANAGK